MKGKKKGGKHKKVRVSKTTKKRKPLSHKESKASLLEKARSKVRTLSRIKQDVWDTAWKFHRKHHKGSKLRRSRAPSSRARSRSMQKYINASRQVLAGYGAHLARLANNEGKEAAKKLSFVNAMRTVLKSTA